ncbi:hypothetical protein F5B22DRAFT_603142 [Xylaria bambusicola]|uniref:uncharacterized protein n=1 Tax=Xylaria bambusicola TaxID=326684 RepID=UPI002007FC7B|nr:uncharacterized protein F5B22DRAFT_603142 [Xylaria bambusicola]KAI0517479.1 hypothetical protein F5B22DRAFT_603142 [Xylaria bambusicola]
MSTFAASDPSTSYEYPVHVGTWINWSRGRVFGATLTVNRRDADLLIAFTSFFIAYVSTRTWRILCFILHRVYSTPGPQDSVYHQRQAILRNSSSPESAIQLLFLLFQSNYLKLRCFRPLPAAAVAAVCIIVFTTAGGLSSQVSTAIGTQVLLEGTRCGYIDDPSPWVDKDRYFKYVSYQTQKTDNAANYAQQCYSDNTTSFLNCNRFITDRLGSNIDADAPCPFNASICRKDTGNLRLDTGFMDSNDHLGLNAPADQRVLWRHVLHCAPLQTTGYTTDVSTPNSSYTLYHYGVYGSEDEYHNYTYLANSLEAVYNDGLPRRKGYADHLVESMRADVKNGTTYLSGSDFIPIDALFRQDADTHLAFLSGNGVWYLDTSTDDWYRIAKEPTNVTWAGADQDMITQVYLPSEPASPMGCADQYQFCNTGIDGIDGCGPLSSLRDAVAGAAPLFNTSYAEFSTYEAESKPGSLLAYFGNVFFSFDITVESILSQLGGHGLLSHRTLSGAHQGPIASNQWQQDFMQLWAISLASTQMAFIDTAVGPADDSLLSLWTDYATPNSNKLCNSQKIRSTAHGSFSLFGLFLIFTLGIVLVLISYLLQPVSEFLCKRKGYKAFAHLEWTTNSALQLQRLAHEEIGMGTWNKCLDTIPDTRKGELLGSLDTTDLGHPVLRPSAQKTVAILDKAPSFGETDTLNS